MASKNLIRFSASQIPNPYRQIPPLTPITMPKKKSTSTSQTEPKKPQVLALKRKPVTPEPDVEAINVALSTPVLETELSVVGDSDSTPGAKVELPDPQPLTENQTPALEAEVKADAQPSAETLTPALEAEVKPDAPTLTPGAKSTRPVLKKKSERDAEASSLTPPTPDLLEAPPDGALFQAVGIIVGDVNFNDEGKATVAIGDKVYPLFYASQRKKAYEALRMEVTKTGVSRQRLLLYPRVMHFPKREQAYNVSFQLVGFFREGIEQAPDAITTDLEDMEFKLSGLWQFIPVCPTPCVSIFKNYTTERKDFIKEADVAVKVRFMKGTHVPVIWRDAPVRPFRFNPKLDKEQQGSAAFVQVKALFVPDKDVFQVLDLTSTPSAQPPRFLKAGKKDRLQVASEKLKAAKGERKKPERQER
jgi:hypothetical protein